jgi:colanic acid/amylovoran biosynthesis glycosyltransferase
MGRNGSVARVRPVVLHYRTVFPLLSETFIRQTVGRHSRYEPVVFTHRRGELDEVVDVRTLAEPPAGIFGLAPAVESFRLRASAAALRSVVQDVTPDIVHAHFGEEGVIAELALRHTGVPFVVSFYGYDATELARRAVWRRRFRRACRRAAAVLAEGPCLAGRLRQLGAPADRLHVQRIPVRLELFPFRVPQPPAATDAVVILQACRFVEKKGVDTTIRAFASVADRIPQAQLWLLGGGPEEDRLRSLVGATGLGERVAFIAARSHEDYAAVMRAAHIFVHPSRTSSTGDEEGGAPTALLEAQAMGLPIIATTHADIPYIVAPDSALLAPPGDSDAVAAAMVHLLTNPQEWLPRAEAARARVEREHDPVRLAARLEDIYDACRGAPPAGAGSGGRMTTAEARV